MEVCTIIIGKETIEGYVATFLVASYKPDYPPSLVSFYLSAEHYLTYLLLRKLDVSKINPVYCELTGIAMFDIGYDYNKEKTWQKLIGNQIRIPKVYLFDYLYRKEPMAV